MRLQKPGEDPDLTPGLTYTVIVNWNGWRETEECLQSCAQLKGVRTVVLVIDNGSTDGSYDQLRKLFPSLRLIQSAANLGFAGACNLGIRAAMQDGAEFVWLLNNDTTVDPAALAELVKALRSRPEAAFAGSKIYYASRPDVLWFAGGALPSLGSEPCHHGIDKTDGDQDDEITACGFITGCSLLVRTAALERIGLLREDYFLYWEDVDWNERAALAGWQRLYVPSSRVWHKVSASSQTETGGRKPVIDRYLMRNFILFHRWRRPRWLVVALLRGGLRTLKILLGEQSPRRSINSLMGLFDGLSGRTGPIRPAGEQLARKDSRASASRL